METTEHISLDDKRIFPVHSGNFGLRQGSWLGWLYFGDLFSSLFKCMTETLKGSMYGLHLRTISCRN